MLRRSGGTGRRTGLKILRGLPPVPVRSRSPAPDLRGCLKIDNILRRHALDAIEGAVGGEVIVIAVDGSDKDVAIWGGLMTAGSIAKKLAGAVLDAGLRDVTEIRRDFGFQIFSRSVSPGTTVTRYKTFANNIPVTCGDIEVNPGDLIVADLDGVVVVPKDKVEEVLVFAEDIEQKEAAQTKFIKETGSLLQGLAKYNRI